MSEPLRLEAALSAVVALLSAQREESGLADEATKTEVVLSNAGLSNGEIGQVLGKTSDAVRMTISRAEGKN